MGMVFDTANIRLNTPNCSVYEKYYAKHWLSISVRGRKRGRFSQMTKNQFIIIAILILLLVLNNVINSILSV